MLNWLWGGIKRVVGGAAGAAWRWVSDRLTGASIELSRFDQVLAVERRAINERRKRITEQRGADDGKRQSLSGQRGRKPRFRRKPLPPPVDTSQPQTFGKRNIIASDGKALSGPPHGSGPSGPDDIVADRPKPQPCDAVGVALSGGGIRSAAFSIGALQALDFHRVLDSTDYLSTVSGGGYAGISLSAGMSVTAGQFPFSDGGDIHDNDAIGHIRNYSNYLMPRVYSGLRNALDVVAILLRGLCANAVVVLTFLLIGALLTWWVYPDSKELLVGSFLPRFFEKAIFPLLAWIGHTEIFAWLGQLASAIGLTGLLEWLTVKLELRLWFGYLIDLFAFPFGFTLFLAGLLSFVLLIWALRRSIATFPIFQRTIAAAIEWAQLADIAWVRRLSQWAFRKFISDPGNDADSPWLGHARLILGATVLSAVLDALPRLVYLLGQYYNTKLIISFGPTSALSIILAFFAHRLGAFLDKTRLSARRGVRLRRVLTQIALVVGALILPIVLLLCYLHLTAWLLTPQLPKIPTPFPIETAAFGALEARSIYCWVLVVLVPVVLFFEGNAYSLHQFYKDRLSKAFLFNPGTLGDMGEPLPLLRFKLSQLTTDYCPYHIVNTALNVQGSREANRRGRDADFFMFTRDFIGSDLTFFARTRSDGPTPTPVMERIDPRLELGSAMAISGAALSANMGSNTVRLLSPTLALLNIRLGYWLRNPRHLATLRWKVIRPFQDLIYRMLGKFFLIVEMFNFLHENSPFVYLSDGGHIENLGIYELLKRGCRLIIAIDAEADPEISCASLLKVERYARIDLGIRIILPWEEIAMRNRETNRAVDPATPEEAERHHGPHCAIGRILYEDGAEGILLYFKSSLTGDEKDYLLDYKKRNRDFPHETTGDQFFTEEQFEVYRALGYHVVEGYFSNSDQVSWLHNAHAAWASEAAAKAEVRRALGWV